MGFKARPPAQHPDSAPIGPIASRLADAVARTWGADGPIRDARVPNVPLLPTVWSDELVEWREPARIYGRGRALIDGLHANRASAVWYALRVVPARDAEIAVDPALALLALEPGTRVRQACAFALGHSTSQRAFDALLAADAYGASWFPGGAGAVRRRLDANPAAAFEPHPAPPSSLWNTWSATTQKAWTARRASAAARYARRDCEAAVEALHYLARHDWLGSWTRIGAFRDHPAHALRLGLGHALIDVATEPALELLLERAHTIDELERLFAVRAAFALGASAAYGRLGGDALLDEELCAVVAAVFEQLSGDHRNVRLGKHPAHGWLQVDERWHDLAVVWARRAGSARDTAKWVLADLTEPQRSAARARARATPPAVRRATASPAPDRATLERWSRAGTFWREAQRIGEMVRAPAVYDAALPIALREMAAVRARLERITATLRDLGYRFVARDPLPAPGPETRAQLVRLESLGGPLPLSIRAAYETIGPVHLAGWHPDWPVPAHTEANASARGAFWATDPLSLVPLPQLIELAEDNVMPDTTYRLAISADDVGKAGFSGGQYSFEMPCPLADTPLDGAHGRPAFVDYLEESLRWGGLPGFARIEGRPEAFLRALTG